MDGVEQTESTPITIKKYANRRLYNTATSSYVTLENLSQMVRGGTRFVVYDAKTGEDITRSVLTQIIVEEEQKGGQNLLPISFLRDLIGFYGNSMQSLVPKYLEHAMKTFQHNQEQLAKTAAASFGGMFPFASIEEVGKQNMALFEQAMRLWTPGAALTPPQPPATPNPPAPQDATAGTFSMLTERINQLQAQMEALSRKNDRDDK